ncbi:MAG: tagaturonate epimerase family protein, partial [Candidatus Bipolaricaulota bacterium]
LPPTEVAKRFRTMPEAPAWRKEYLDREFDLKGWGKVRFTEEDLACTAVKYGAAVRFAIAMHQALRGRCPAGFDFELSVDETETPTSPFEHLFLVHELRRHDITLTGLAPRFPGAMEKGVDWRGDLTEFREAVRVHIAIARTFGPYRLSLHSGSDKFSLYPILAEEAGDLWHVKTAGTSYLVALEVAARHAPALFREIARFSLDRFPEDRKTYHLSADPGRVPDLEAVPDQGLPQLLAHDDARQVLHVAFGSVLRSQLGEDLCGILEAHDEEHYGALARHLGRHLAHLGVTDDG